MATKEELISDLKFSSSIKNALRDYYNYGFKKLDDMTGDRKKGTIKNDWNRLNYILNLNNDEAWSWSENLKGAIFASVDSQNLSENPFHRIYRFCNNKNMKYFFEILYAFYVEHRVDESILNKFMLKNEKETDENSKNLQLEFEEKTDRKWKEYWENRELTKRQFEDISKSFWSKTSELMKRIKEDKTAKEDKTLENQLGYLKNLGLIICHQEKGDNGGAGDKRWELLPFTMSSLIEKGKKIDGFESHLKNAIDFYSKYYILGEVGTFLLDRMSPKFESRIRLKSEYFMQSLNDYNLIDLWEAIDKKKWCYIKYRHAIRDKETAVLCYPLELRVSSTSGREMLMYYEPFKRSCTAFRLEFINEIFCYTEEEIIKILKNTNQAEVIDYLDTDRENARKLLKHTWGVSMPVPQENNVVSPPKLHHVKLSVQFEKNKEYYILNRMRRECRSGKVTELENQIDFEIDVVDTKEMRPWIRSFYKRIISCEGLESRRFSLTEDIHEFSEQLEKNILEEHKRLPEVPKVILKVPDEVKKILEKNNKKASAHKQIFNSVFNIYSYLIAEILANGGSKRDAMNKYRSKTGNITSKLLKDYSYIWERLDFTSVYKGKEVYKELVPLTKIEVRWLKTILQDERIYNFLSTDEFQIVKEWLEKQSYASLPMEFICYYDRYHFLEEINIERNIFSVLLDGIYNEEILSITYNKTTSHGKISGRFKPVIMEFSKRSNRFQLHMISCEDHRVYRMNLSGIEKIQNTKEKFDWNEAKQSLDNSKKRDEKSVEIEFWNILNIPDRILTEFSPWKKECVCIHKGEERSVYRLKIYYQSMDEKELVIRLMGYGANIRFVDDNHSILQEIQNRVREQLGAI